MIVGGSDLEVAEWVADRCPHLSLDTPYTAIGWETCGVLTAGAVFDNYTRINIDTHIAIDEKRVSRLFLGECFRYVFEQLACKRITARVARSNQASIRFCLSLGFKPEGICREALSGGEDLCIYGMLARECSWLDLGRTKHAA